MEKPQGARRREYAYVFRQARVRSLLCILKERKEKEKEIERGKRNERIREAREPNRNRAKDLEFFPRQMKLCMH